MAKTHPFLFAIAALSLTLTGCDHEPEAVAGSADMELAENADDGTLTDEMNSGQPEIRKGGGMAVGEADNPNEPVIPEDAERADRDPGEVR